MVTGACARRVLVDETLCLIFSIFYAQSARKSALLSSAKKAKLKSNPSRVRFAEGVLVNGSPLCPVSGRAVSFPVAKYSAKRFTPSRSC